MYGSTCADMQVDVMGECLSSIKHVVGTTSGCFYPRSNHWEVGGRPQCDKCGCRVVRNCSQHRFTTLETISNSIRGFSSGRPRGTTPADDRYIVLQARRNRRQTVGEIARHTTRATGRPISRLTVARRLYGGGLFARCPVRCVPLTPAHRRRRSLWCREHRNWRDNEWGRVLFTDESRFSLSSDSHRILIWRERGSRNHPSNIIERDRYGGRGVLVWGGIMLGSRTDLHIFDAGSVNGTRYSNEILLPYVRLFRGAMGLQFLFMDDNAPCNRTVAAEQLLESRRLAARTLPPVTIRELRLALQDEWAAMPQQLIDTLILSMGRRCETCLAGKQELADVFVKTWAILQKCPSAPEKLGTAVHNWRKFEELYNSLKKDVEQLIIEKESIEEDVMMTKHSAEVKQAQLKEEIEKLKIERDFYRDYCDELLLGDRKEWKPLKQEDCKKEAL
ncbi:transposable element Tcb2 transposase [Trichonephila clavipes]|nr:transposable element Tcb2 transposase [Trichonephila clavipes]